MLQPSNPEHKTKPGRRLLQLGRRGAVVLAIAILALAAMAVAAWLQPTRSVSTVSVTVGDISARVNANARVRALRSARLAFPLSGRLAGVPVQEGDTVKAGDLLAELQADELDRRLKQAELTVQSRQLDLERAQAAPRTEDLEIARANLKKAALNLAAAEDNAKRNPGSSSDAAREAAQADYDIARANFDRLTRGPTTQELELLKNNLAAAQLDLETARTAKAQSQLRAPYDGIITEVNAQPGELVGGYNPVVAIADLTQLELFADIDEIDVGSVAPGQSAQISLDAFPGVTLEGKLTRLFPAASNERGALVYHARIQFDKGDLPVRPGMGATVKIATAAKKNVLLIPTRAIRTAGAQKIVSEFVNGVIRNVVVQTGLSDGNQTEIVSGLEPGARLVIQ